MALTRLFIFRMTHIDNVPFILRNGLWSKLSAFQDPSFKAIGNADIIGRRTNKRVVVIPPGGVLGEYVPFCFTDGYESAYALEVLASVSYVRSQGPGISLDDSIRRIESWSQRKKDLFKLEHIQAAYQHLDTWMNRANKTLEPLN